MYNATTVKKNTGFSLRGHHQGSVKMLIVPFLLCFVILTFIQGGLKRASLSWSHQVLSACSFISLLLVNFTSLNNSCVCALYYAVTALSHCCSTCFGCKFTQPPCASLCKSFYCFTLAMPFTLFVLCPLPPLLLSGWAFLSTWISGWKTRPVPGRHPVWDSAWDGHWCWCWWPLAVTWC